MIWLIFMLIALCTALALNADKKVLQLIAGIGVVLGLGGHGLTPIFAVIVGVLAVLLSVDQWRRQWLVKPALETMSKVMPQISQTEREALDAGTVSWDGELFSGRPDFALLRSFPKAELSEREQAFIDGPVEALCAMIDDWQVRAVDQKVSDALWDKIKSDGFLSMIIPESYGGLGFSHHAQSEVVSKVASRSAAVGVSVMVPNSLGPGELLMLYGTDQQKDHYLPRLAKGDDIPCFALTGARSGSDAAGMPDVGIVCKGQWQGEEVIGLKLSWDKRYITLAPIATLIGVAFYARDPEGLLGGEVDLGITLALLPSDHEGVNSGMRHNPNVAFMNGPTWGRDVFIPMDWIIGGQPRLGDGWRMLMNALAVGRAISLPAMGTVTLKYAARYTGGYAKLREQFNLPIGKMEGVAEPLARIAHHAFAMESTRCLTNSILSQGEKPSVLSALFKYTATERMRMGINDTNDILGGKAICDGPRNVIAAPYQAVPVAITVEGANILTRTLIVFAQGALRSHPYLLKEVEAIENPDRAEAVVQLDQVLCAHLSAVAGNYARSLGASLSGGRLRKVGPVPKALRSHYQQLSVWSGHFALVADALLAVLGGDLKRKQMITGRMSDALSSLYVISAALHQYENTQSIEGLDQLLDLTVKEELYTVQSSLAAVLANLPFYVRIPIGFATFTFGQRLKRASDKSRYKVAQLMQSPGDLREFIGRGIYIGEDETAPMAQLEKTLAAVTENQALYSKTRQAKKALMAFYGGPSWVEQLAERGDITPAEAETLTACENMIDELIAVDQFAPDLYNEAVADTEHSYMSRKKSTS